MRVNRLQQKLIELKQARTATKFIQNEPFSSASEFLNKYKPVSQCIDLARLLKSKAAAYVKQKQGYYYGEIKHGLKSGMGVYFFIDGTVYEGNWKKGVGFGQAYESYPDGSFFQGNFVNGRANGTGKLYKISGEEYEGEFQNGKQSGPGIFRSKKGHYYVGEWRDGKIEGFGVMNEPNGQKYQGMIKNQLKHGKGILKLPNGDIYKGYFHEGELSGYGEYFWSNGNYYSGEWKKGKREGPGSYTQKHPSPKSYQGYYRDDLKSGYGVMIWGSGSCYKGFFERDVRQGYGEVFWSDGNIYRGWWREGLEHGKGELFVKGKGLMVGIFSNNQLTVLIEFRQLTRDEYLSGLEGRDDQKLQQLRKKLKKDIYMPIKLPETPKRAAIIVQRTKKYQVKRTKIPSQLTKQIDLINSNLQPKIKTMRSSIHEVSTQRYKSEVQSHRHSVIEEKTQRILHPDLVLPRIPSNTQREKRSHTVCQKGSPEKVKNLHSSLTIHRNFLKSKQNQKAGKDTDISQEFWNTKIRSKKSEYKKIRVSSRDKASVCHKD